MNILRRETKQASLIHQKIRKASFEKVEEKRTFKYFRNFSKLKKAKNLVGLIKSKYRLWIQEVDLKAVLKTFKYQIPAIILETFIEGLAINYIVKVLLGFKFNIFTIFAYGILIKQVISIVERLRKHGGPTTVYKNEQAKEQ